MNVRRAAFPTIFALLTGMGTASAQSAYVGASLFGDIVRRSHTESSFSSDTGSGEAMGFALRIGAPLGSNWGVDLEFARPSTIDGAADFVYPAILAGGLEGLPDAITGLPNAPAIYPPIFPIPIALETRDRHTTLSTSVWALQNVSSRVALVYLGGVAFNRFHREYVYAFRGVEGFSVAEETVTYGARPVVGFEAWISLTDNVTLTPGLRLHGIQDGWLVRPGVGIAWSF